MQRSVALFSACVLSALATSHAAADTYDPPVNYYNNATGVGSTLRTQLRSIISTGFVARSYGDARYAFGVLDTDPNNSNRILLAYNRASVSKTWDSGATFNREHIWPASLLGVSSPGNGYTGPASDLFELRPTTPSVNSSRGNYPYGKHNVATPAQGYGVVSGNYFNPGNADRGDVSRAIFYMATRYSNLNIVESYPSTLQMGELSSLLRWHYADPVDAFERRRNHMVYSSVDNPQYYQGNRNPFIDHPEYVWAIFGSGENTSQLTVSATAGSAGGSNLDVDFGKVIAGSSFSNQTVYLNKSGNTPTTYDVTATGNATSNGVGSRQTFGYEPSNRNITVGLSGSTATPGARTGTITIDNTDLTGSSGRGVTDVDDTINLTGTVVSHARPSFSTSAVVTTKLIDFGIVAYQSAQTFSESFDLANFGSIGAFTAALDVDSVGNVAGPFETNLVAGTSIDVGTALTYSAIARTDGAIGQHQYTINILTSDEDIPGATSFAPLGLTLRLRSAYAGDATLDDAVNFDDLLVLAQHYGQSGTTWATGDFNRSGTTDFDDLLSLAQFYGTSSVDIAGLSADFAADWALARSLVPEPSALVVLSFTLVGVSMRRR